MANQYNNKVTLQNGTTLIDLTTDTVTDASHIMTGHRGHLADGSVVDGTGASESQVVSIKDVPNSTGITAEITGVPAPEGSISITTNGTHDVYAYEEAVVAVPSIDVPTFSSSDGVTITCDKTYAQCLAILNGGENRAFISLAGSNPDSLAGFNDLGILRYHYVYAGALSARIDYRSNGSITISSVDTGQTLNVTSNGTYTQSDDNAWARVNVNVPTGSATIQPLTVTSNGTYTAPSGVDGYSPVTVNVSGGGGGGGDSALKAFIERSTATPALPSDLTSIGNYSFYGYTSLALDSLPSGVTSIGLSAFYNCSSLALTSLPSGVNNIPASVFYGCTSLALTSLPSGVTSIGSSAFYGCSSLALTSLPSGVSYIGTYAFYNCTSLALTSLPSGITSIENYSFANCSGLTQMILPGTVTSIGNSVFKSCRNLSQITIPNSVTSIGTSAFSGCTSLTSVSCSGTIASLGASAFIGAETTSPMALRSVMLPNLNVGAVAVSFGSTTAGYACQSLVDVDLGSARSINANAFANCYSLQTLVLRRSGKVCSLANVSAFLNTPLRGYNSLTATVYVPSALIETYKTAANWKTIYDAGSLTFAAIEGSEWEL